MRTVRTVAEVRVALSGAHERRERIGLVPTMGALHGGHRALLRAARGASDVVVMSLFVNPTQFDDAADLGRYPRDEATDAAVAAAEGVDLLFAPTADELYPEGFATTVDPGPLGQLLEGAARPGHFRGVATICTKLFAIVSPGGAWFGQKDAQQVAVVRRVVRDLDLAVIIHAVPTVREGDGLARSSRNVFLDPEERRAAATLPRALRAGAEAASGGADPVTATLAVLATSPELVVDYVDVAGFDVPTLVAAVRIGGVRLIDNVRLVPDGP
jgi:pantoate--beta-alanine ligase